MGNFERFESLVGDYKGELEKMEGCYQLIENVNYSVNEIKGRYGDDLAKKIAESVDYFLEKKFRNYALLGPSELMSHPVNMERFCDNLKAEELISKVNEIWESFTSQFKVFKDYIGNNWRTIEGDRFYYNGFVKVNEYLNNKRGEYGNKMMDEVARKLNDYLKDEFISYIQSGHGIGGFCLDVVCGVPLAGGSNCGNALIKKANEILKPSTNYLI